MSTTPSTKAVPTRPGVYLLVNKINSKLYVGSAANAKERCQTHIRELKLDGHHKTLFD